MKRIVRLREGGRGRGRVLLTEVDQSLLTAVEIELQLAFKTLALPQSK